MDLENGALTFYTNSSLTPGNTFTPANVFTLYKSGNMLVAGSGAGPDPGYAYGNDGNADRTIGAIRNSYGSQPGRDLTLTAGGRRSGGDQYGRWRL